MLYERIMNLETEYGGLHADTWMDGYESGKEDAATFAKEADELMEEMADTIAVMKRWIEEGGSNAYNESIGDICKMGEDAVKKHKNWKDQTK